MMQIKDVLVHINEQSSLQCVLTQMRETLSTITLTYVVISTENKL